MPLDGDGLLIIILYQTTSSIISDYQGIWEVVYGPMSIYCLSAWWTLIYIYISMQAMVPMHLRFDNNTGSLGRWVGADRWNTRSFGSPRTGCVSSDRPTPSSETDSTSSVGFRTSARWRWWWRAGIRPSHSRAPTRARIHSYLVHRVLSLLSSFRPLQRKSRPEQEPRQPGLVR